MPRWWSAMGAVECVTCTSAYGETSVNLFKISVLYTLHILWSLDTISLKLTFSLGSHRLQTTYQKQQQKCQPKHTRELLNKLTSFLPLALSGQVLWPFILNVIVKALLRMPLGSGGNCYLLFRRSGCSTTTARVAVGLWCITDLFLRRCHEASFNDCGEERER